MWTKSLTTLVLLASVSQLGYSRALPVESGETHDLKQRELPADHGFGAVTHWSRRGEDAAAVLNENLDRRAEPVIVDPHEPVVPVGPKTDPGTTTDPKTDPSTGLDPTKPSTPTTSDPKDDPSAGLDPTKSDPDPKPSTDPEPKPSSEPTTSDPDSDPADLCPIGKRGLDKRCTPPAWRANAPPATDEHAHYDYLDQVQKDAAENERLGETKYVNNYLERLKTKNAARQASTPIDMSKIKENYEFGSAENKAGKPKPAEPGESEAKPYSFENDFATGSKELNHQPFKKAMEMMGVKLSDKEAAEREDLWSKGPPSATGSTVGVSWEKNGKVLYADSSYTERDTNAAKEKYTTKTMAILEERGVDPSKIEVFNRMRINNQATQDTIDSIFKQMKVKKGNDFLVLKSSDTGLAGQCWDAFFRTPNGKATVDPLAFYGDKWGYRAPDQIVLFKPNLGGTNIYGASVHIA